MEGNNSVYIYLICMCQAFWNWVEHYPDEFTMLYQRPQADMAGEWHKNSYPY